jgi:spermidine synthase
MSSRLVWSKWFLKTLVPYGARLLVEEYDEYGGLRVIELGRYRALYFDSPSCQGRLHLKKPWKPSSEYLHSLMVGAGYAQNIQRILILGLGPGALVHTLHHLYPEAVIETVELRDKVYQLAEKYFNLPTQSDQFIYTIDDATHFIKRAHQAYDLIIVDMAMSDSISPLLVQPGFWDHIITHLTPEGVLCANLWKGAEHRFEWIFNHLGQSLSTPPFILHHQQLDNLVVFGSPTPYQKHQWHTFRKRVKEIGQALEFNPEALLNQFSFDLDS